MANILSVDDLHKINHYLAKFNSEITYKDHYLKKILASFEDEQIVQQFYKSGNFGETQRKRIQELRDAMTRYYKIISDGPESLISQTKKYVEEQLSLQNASYYEAGRARRESN